MSAPGQASPDKMLLARWLSLADEERVPPPPGFPHRARFSLTPAQLELPVLHEDAARVRDVLIALFERPGILRSPAPRRSP